MAFDFKKEYREFYLPKDRPEIVAVPSMHYMAVRGQGDPNQPEGAYRQAIQMLYTVAYTLKMSGRAGHEIDGFFDYVVPPLEGFWRLGLDMTDKTAFRWISVIRLPDFVTEEVARMDSFLAEKGYVNDLSETRMHHEIYLSDARRVIPEKWKTVIRHPIRRG